jgi:peptidoglycan/LPS O-acetylase OafA/YrhL
VQELLMKFDVDKNGNLMFAVCMLACIIGAWLLHLSIEKPFMKIRDRILRNVAPKQMNTSN